jgi:hypothetical protein
MGRTCQFQGVDGGLNEGHSRQTDRWFGQDSVVKGPNNSRHMGVLRAPEAGDGMCFQRRIASMTVTVRYIYSAGELVSAFDGLEMWR